MNHVFGVKTKKSFALNTEDFLLHFSKSFIDLCLCLKKFYIQVSDWLWVNLCIYWGIINK